MFNDASTKVLIEEHRDFKPVIVVIDTLSKATGGADINAPNVGIGIHTAMDALSDAFGGALVILIHHPNKSSKVGSSGSSFIEDLAYAVWHVSREGELVKCWVEKMKDGPAEFTVNYRVGIHRTVPYVRDETASERNERAPRASELRRAVLDFLSQKPGVAVSLEDVEKALNVQPKTLKRHVLGEKKRNGTWRVKPDLADLVARDRFGNPLDYPIMLMYQAGGEKNNHLRRHLGHLPPLSVGERCPDPAKTPAGHLHGHLHGLEHPQKPWLF